MRKSHLTLRLRPSLPEEIRRLAAQEGVTVDQLSALRTEAYVRERGSRADIDEAHRILARAGKGNPPAPGDELL